MGRKIWKAIGKAVTLLLSLGALVGLYLTLVVAQPQPEDPSEAPAPQPLLTASPAQEIREEGDLRELVASFPGPVMSFMSGSGMTFVSGTSADYAYQGQFGRILTLYWQTEEGVPLILQSIYPSEALELMGKGDYSMILKAGPILFGRQTIYMENEDTIRVHAQVPGEGLYVLTLPKGQEEILFGVDRSIQLFTAGEE